MGRILTIDVTPQDFASAKEYITPWGCPLWHAIHREIPDESASVGAWTVRIGEDNYKIVSEWGEVGFAVPADTINGYIGKAKISLEGIPTISVTLELINN